MNINANEILFLNKMRKMNEVNSGVNGDNTTSNPMTTALNDEGQLPEANPGLKALMFQGLNNLMNDPQLAQETGVLNNTLTQPETTTDKTTAETGFVAPYSSNLAFQGGKGNMIAKLRQGAVGALGALTVLAGTPGLLTSCEKSDVPETYQYMSVTINQNSSIEELAAALASGQQVTNQLLSQILQNAIAQGQTIEEILAKLGAYEGMIGTVINLLTQGNQLLTALRNDMNKNDAEILAAIIQVKEAVNTLNELAKDYPQYTDQINQLISAVQTGNIGIENLNAQIASLYQQMAANGDIEQETLQTVKEILASNKSGAEKLLEVIDLLKSINIKLDVVISQLREIWKNDQRILKSLDAIEKGVQLGVYKQEIANRTLKALLYTAQKSSAATQAKLAEVIAKLGEVTDKQDITNEQLAQIGEVTSSTNEAIVTYGEEGEKFAQDVLQYIAALGFDMNRKFSALIAKATENGVTLNSMAELLALMKAGLDEDKENNKIFQDKALSYIAALAFDMNHNLNQVIALMTKMFKAIEDNNILSSDIKNIAQKIMDKFDTLDARQKESTADIIEAINNIKVTGGNVDLSSIKEAIVNLTEIVKQNGDVLTSIDVKIDLLNITAKSIEAKLSDEYGKNDARYTNIMNGINALKANSDKYDDAELLAKFDLLLNKLDDIAQAIKDHNITIDVTGKVTCNCNCGANHEGILSDINQVLQAPQSNATRRKTAVKNTVAANNLPPKGSVSLEFYTRQLANASAKA